MHNFIEFQNIESNNFKKQKINFSTKIHDASLRLIY